MRSEKKKNFDFLVEGFSPLSFHVQIWHQYGFLIYSYLNGQELDTLSPYLLLMVGDRGLDSNLIIKLRNYDFVDLSLSLSRDVVLAI